ncbi:MAG TPA: DNA polymerase III subunit epsilon [Roseiarcus sp.]|nr:DNA polymerase III subunit epsilon [Roseiarcus sp.]
MREIVLDTETTGLSPTDGHRVVEIGAVEIVHQVATGKVFHKLINPERDVPEEAQRVHGHTTEYLREKPTFAEIVEEFLAFIGDAPLVIHNAEFDMAFVNEELERLGRQPIGAERVVDTLALARSKHPGLANNLDALCDRYRIDRTRRAKHGALLDAEILVEVYGELMGGRQGSLAFDDHPERYRPILASKTIRVEPRPPRQRLISPLEATLHFDHVMSALGEGAVWLRFARAWAHPESQGSRLEQRQEAAHELQ